MKNDKNERNEVKCVPVYFFSVFSVSRESNIPPQVFSEERSASSFNCLCIKDEHSCCLFGKLLGTIDDDAIKNSLNQKLPIDTTPGVGKQLVSWFCDKNVIPSQWFTCSSLSLE
jgi:hypothetical protein